MSSIRLLPDHLVNQIAAGEVIERPASVLKELIENSLDGGASVIEVVLTGGGIQFLSVKDNGKGIPAEELALAVSRHATSKLKAIDDLNTLLTLGFRGEGLASIASISRLELTSRVASAPYAARITVEQSRPSTVQPAALAQGTLVEVQDLFWTVPARRKFLKSEKTEAAQCEAVFCRIALAHPHCAFRLTHENKRLYDLKAGDPTQRIYHLMGEAFSQTALKVDAHEDNMRLNGYVSNPTNGQLSGLQHFTFVNGRFVRDRVLIHAVKQAYEDVLHPSRDFAYVLFLTLDPAEVDVNAHPTKTEIRFRDRQAVWSLVFQAVQTALNHAKAGGQEEENLAEESTAPSLPSSIRSTSSISHEHVSGGRVSTSTAHSSPAPSEGMAFYQQLFGQPAMAMEEPAPVAMPLSVEMETPALGFALAQLHGRYLLAEQAEGLIVVDIHAAHERLMYEQFKATLAGQPPQIQMLMVPYRQTLSSELIAILETHEAHLKAWGFSFTLEASQCVIEAIPDFLLEADTATFFRQLLEELAEYGMSHAVEAYQHAQLGTRACHAAIRGGQRLSLGEMNALLRQLEQCPRSGQCNHGRPTWKRLSLQEIDAFFMQGR